MLAQVISVFLFRSTMSQLKFPRFPLATRSITLLFLDVLELGLFRLKTEGKNREKWIMQEINFHFLLFSFLR